MKFFTNLPQTNFESTIGTFSIANFFTYLDVAATQVQEAPVTLDDKTTLIEASSMVYGDPNSLWAFVAANNTVNPFKLLSTNSYIFSENSADKINLILLPGATAVTGGTAFPVGSIILPYEGNTGATFLLGSTGNFNINGPFAIIEQSSFYDGNMVIGAQQNTTQNFIVVGATSERVTVIARSLTGGYSWAGSYYTGNKKKYSNKVVAQTLVKDAKTIYKELISSNPTIDDYLPSPPPVLGTTAYVSTTASEQVDNADNQIQAYIPSQLGTIQASFVTAKYN